MNVLSIKIAYKSMIKYKLPNQKWSKDTKVQLTK